MPNTANGSSATTEPLCASTGQEQGRYAPCQDGNARGASPTNKAVTASHSIIDATRAQASFWKALIYVLPEAYYCLVILRRQWFGELWPVRLAKTAMMPIATDSITVASKPPPMHWPVIPHDIAATAVTTTAFGTLHEPDLALDAKALGTCPHIAYHK